jgi:hypothetical protein
MVESLPSKHKALSSKFNTAKKKKPIQTPFKAKGRSKLHAGPEWALYSHKPPTAAQRMWISLATGGSKAT